MDVKTVHNDSFFAIVMNEYDGTFVAVQRPLQL